ncbi:SH2 domain-containing protein A-like [Impatiens glandulifera]|uniref:SH2 domain-containing protein A-like n=1 Tax=Impatiens glandulifera TaxID=253017 RepID=UPI001FB0B041|nr:SH2 domain-containing protein A-like [Impatiens glandulifera]
MSSDDEAEVEVEYISLKDLKMEISCEDGLFTLCFWLFLTSPVSYPFTLLQQFLPDNADGSPFISLDEENILTLSPLNSLNKESQAPVVTANKVFPIGVWVHVGCEITSDCIRLHYDGDIVGEVPLKFSPSLKNMSLSALDEDIGKSKCYFHSIEVLSPESSMKDHLIKDPPHQILIDRSTTSEIEEENDGVWSIVGGKASCRRNFSVDVVLLDVFGKHVNKEMEVAASLLYADNGCPVQRPSDAEAPLLTSHDGIEFTSFERPSKLINGRASFKLKITQLSSKCDNRLFLIRFDVPAMGEYPFLEVFSSPIRCISRGRSTRIPLTFKKPGSATHLFNGSSDIAHNSNVHEAKSSPSSKRVKLGQGNSFSMYKSSLASDQADECNSHAGSPDENDCTYENRLEQRRREDNEDMGKSTSDSERNSDLKSMSTGSSSNSDLAIFKYCLGGLNERAVMLKETAMLASERQLMDFAHQVSLYLQCSHHGHQIMIAKRLTEEGTKAWDLITRGNSRVKWVNVETEIKRQFQMISCSSRSLTQQDMEILRRIGGCGEFVACEEFEKIWCWLYPVAFTLSRQWVNGLWNSTASTKWIEGFITKEEAESSLQGAWGVQDPGTFVLRFPTSRSWPHPDAGNLVVTYVGKDYTIHHKLISVDLIQYRYNEKQGINNIRSLEEMLLEEPDLSQLGRILRAE